MPRSGLRGHYYTNLSRTGEPLAVSIDQSLSTDTLDNGVAGVWVAYAVEWSGFLVVDRQATYEFAIISDDGSDLWIDDRLIVDNSGQHGAQEARGSVTLDAGVHPIRVQYEQDGGAFSLDVKFARRGEPVMPIPARQLLPDYLPYGEYRLRRALPAIAAVLTMLLWVAAGRALARRGPPRQAATRPLAIDRTATAVAIIVVVGVAVRIVMMLGSDAILWGDSDVFLETFGAIRAGHLLEHDPHRTLLYPYFLTAFLIWSGEPPMDQIIVAAQHVLGVLSAVCFFLAGRRVFGPRPALAGSLLLTLHTTQLFYEISILSETLFTFLLSAALIPMTAFVAAPTIRGAIVTALACAVLTLTRPVAEWFFVVPLCAALVIVKAWRTRLALVAATVATLAVILTPWAMVNQRTFGTFAVALGRGFGMMIRVFDIDRLPPPAHTNYPDVGEALAVATRTGQYSPATFVRDELRRRHHSSADADSLMNGFAMEAVAEHPVRFAINSLQQWVIQLAAPLEDEAICPSINGPYVCSKRTQGYAREPFLNRPRSADQPVRPWVVSYIRHFQIPMAVVVGLALFGLVAYVAEQRPDVVRGVYLAAVVGYFTFLPAFGQSPQDRYRLPIDGLLFMFAAFGLTRLRFRQAGPPAPKRPADDGRGSLY